MAFQTLNNGESMSSARTKINTNFTQAVEFATTETAGQFNKLTSPTFTATTRLNYAGYFYATRVYSAVYNDYAEWFEREGTTMAGDIIGLNIETGKYRKAQKGDVVVGVESDMYGVIIGGDGYDNEINNFIPVGLMGRLYVNVQGEVKAGQYITLLDNGIGIATDTADRDTVGIALQNTDVGEVLILTRR